MVKHEHSDEAKKVRRKIEETLRQDFTEDQIFGLASLLKIIETRPQDKIHQD